MILRWLRRLFGRKSVNERKIPWPTTEQINLLPWFDGLGLNDIIVVANEHDARRAYDDLIRESVVGIDTESKPTFVRNQKSTGPHVAQFSTLKHAYVFMLHHPVCRKTAGMLIERSELKKVGFGLDDDLKKFRMNMHLHPASVLDLETIFRKIGYGRGVGVKVAVAIVFKKRFRKSKRASTSNWASHHLSEKQLLYAANDAYAAIKVFHALPSK